MLFKIQHWPAATIISTAGAILLAVIVLPWYTFITWKEEKHVSSRFIFMITGFVLILVPGALINLNLQDSYNNGYFSHHDQQQAMFRYRYNSIETEMLKYRDSLNYPIMEQLNSITNDVITVISEIQVRMVEEAQGKPGIPAVKPVSYSPSEPTNQIQYNNIANPFITSPVSDFLFQGCKTRQELDKTLLDYENALSDMSLTDDFQNYKSLLESSLFLPETQKGNEISLMSGLHSLELLKNSVLIVESKMLTAIKKK
jgi:hypothetical protein